VGSSLRIGLAALSVLAVTSCVRYALAPEDAASVRDVADLTLRNYERGPETTLAAARDRAAFCAAERVLVRNDAGPPDAGGAIVCQPPPPPKPVPIPSSCRESLVCQNHVCTCAWREDAGP
jgi:hypothetical protein